MKRFALSLVLLIVGGLLLGPLFVQAACTSTTNLALCKQFLGDPNYDANENSNKDKLDAPAKLIVTGTAAGAHAIGGSTDANSLINITSNVGIGSQGLRMISNGGGRSVYLVNNSTDPAAIGLRVDTQSTATPPSAASAAVHALATGYYAGYFVNVSDRGVSDADNASLIGLVAQSKQANAGYFEQGGSTQTLTRSNSYAGLYATRTHNGALGANDFTGPLVKAEDTTASTGDLLRLTKQASDKFRVDSGGFMVIAAKAFASLGTPANGTFVYCNDCTIASPCAGSGTGAFAKRLNSVWVCN